MAWKRIPGLPGRLYVPEPGPPKKHPCRNCHACQWCDETRCRVCRCGTADESPPVENGGDDR